MLFRWFPWRFIIRKVARARGFLDPITLISQLQNFAKPSEVAIPTELMRLAAVLHARGLVNSQVIQHNLDWVWPYWVEKQFNPRDPSFIPRAFSLTHINLTQRNWTAIGIPDIQSLPIVDPRGLVTPFYDGWSIDFWIMNQNGKTLFPSRLKSLEQRLDRDGEFLVMTQAQLEDLFFKVKAKVEIDKGEAICDISLTGSSREGGWLVVAIRPYNPEGISFIKDIEINKNRSKIIINKKKDIFLNLPFDRHNLSTYHQGDVSSDLFSSSEKEGIHCPVGMATGAFFYRIGPSSEKTIKIKVPLEKVRKNKKNKPREKSSDLKIPNKLYQYLYESSKKTLALHCGNFCFAGPFTYKRFWIRDAVFALQALLYSGQKKRAGKLLDLLFSTQKINGYFSSQYGEWDSNGQVLWAIKKFTQLTNQKPYDSWQKPIRQAVRWIQKKRLPEQENSPYSGLLPAGFSAEHFGPNDFYYWDDFWALAGVKASLFLQDFKKDEKTKKMFERCFKDLEKSIQNSLNLLKNKTKKDTIPASYSRRMDSAAIGSLVAGYPLQLWGPEDKRLLDTAEYLIQNCFYQGVFFHDMSHSGLNPYLTLFVAQVLLRAGDSRFSRIIKSIANLSSSTGAWPEAVHPKTHGGCMGDGQHVWAAAEWISIIRNCFLREEEEEGKLILCSGVGPDWYQDDKPVYLKNALSIFGEISVEVIPGNRPQVNWQANWYGKRPIVEIFLPGYGKAESLGGSEDLLRLEKDSL